MLIDALHQSFRSAAEGIVSLFGCEKGMFAEEAMAEEEEGDKTKEGKVSYNEVEAHLFSVGKPFSRSQCPCWILDEKGYEGKMRDTGVEGISDHSILGQNT